MSLTFSERLQSVLRRGNLRVADAARLFARPHPTVNGWIKRKLNPSGGPKDVDDAYDMLGRLEGFLQRRGKLLPVPTGLSPTDRIRHVRRLRERIISLKGGKS